MSSETRRHLTLAQTAEPDSARAAGALLAAAGTAVGVNALDANTALDVTPSTRVTDGTGCVDGSGLLQVGDLAKATGKTVRAIHLYEDLGLIEAARRSPGRYRLFSPDAKVRVRWISKLQSLGLSLTEIQAIVQRRHSSESARVAAMELQQVYTEKLAEVRDKLREYLALEQELEASLIFLEGCQQSCAAGVHTSGCSACERHVEPKKGLPDLVVGAELGASPF